MRKFLIFFLIPSLFAASIQPDFEKEKYISTFRQTLLNKGVKLLDKTKKTPSYKPHELIVDLRNPSYKNGILTTHEGGVIKGEDIRIQARTIQYIKRLENNKPVHKIEAEGDLIIQYKGRVYVGEELEYDFTTKSGTVYEGRTFASPWYLGGDKIELKNDGSYHVENVFITSCENYDSTWDIHAGRVSVLKRELLSAKKVRFRVMQFPSIWLPSFKINLKKFIGTPTFRYNVNWDKKSGPRGTIRYRLFSWRDFALWGRLEYRLNMGWGGAIETEYEPDNKRTTFQTRNYLASDVIPKELYKQRRYRVQGVFHTTSVSEQTKLDVTWDKFSDINMPSDFKSDDFELDTAKRTELFFRHQENYLVNYLYVHPRVNGFDTIEQDLPTSYVTTIPYKIPYIDLVFYNRFIASYLDYAYSDKLSPSLKDFESIKLETNNVVSRPFNSAYLNFTPYAGFTGIFYNRSPEHKEIGQAAFLYGGNLNTNFYKNYKRHKHIIQPYIQYEGITQPTQRVDTYYVFSIDDGYNKLNLVKTGILNQVYSLKHIRCYPTYEIDLFANTFLDSHFIPRTLPKLYLDIRWNLPSVYFITNTAWNFYEHTLDFSNFRLGWTVNENLAMDVEFRYRSPYDYRKSDHKNFILDVSRNEYEILQTPISDRRNTVLTHMYFRLNPYWTCELTSHHGWNRKNEPPYNEYKVDLYTMVSSSWKARITYQHTTTDDRVTGAIMLVK